MSVGHELHALGGHLVEAAIDDVLLQLELRNAIAKQSTNAVRLFVDRYRMPCATELLRGRKPSRTRTYDCYALAATMLRQNRMNPSFEKPSLDDVFLILLDCDRRLSDAQNARCDP